LPLQKYINLSYELEELKDIYSDSEDSKNQKIRSNINELIELSKSKINNFHQCFVDRIKLIRNN